MQKNWLKLMAVAGALALTGSAQAAVVLHDDAFIDGSGTNNGIRDYRSAGSFDVDFTADRARAAAISFDFFGSGSVDGTNAWQDNYVFALNGVTLFEGTFGLGGGGGDAVFANSNGFAYLATSPGSWRGGLVSVSGMIDLVAGLNKFTFSFVPVGAANNGVQPLGDEGWGVNRVELAPVPVPAALPLLAGAIAGLSALGLRRRRARA